MSVELMMMAYWKVVLCSQGKRLFSSSATLRASVCKALVYDKLGQPEDVVKYEHAQEIKNYDSCTSVGITFLSDYKTIQLQM